MRNLNFLLAIFAISSFRAQTKIDSLQNDLHTIANDSLKAKRYLDIGYEYLRINQDSALVYYRKCQEFARNRNVQHYVALSTYRLGAAYVDMNQLDKAESYLQMARDQFKKIGNAGWVLSVKVKLGEIAAKQNKFPEAMDRYLEAIPLAQELEKRNLEARIYNNLGLLFMNLKQYAKVITYFQQALEIVTELNFKPGISACLTNIGASYYQLKQYDKALEHLEAALKLKEEAGDKVGAIRVLNNLGMLFIDQSLYERSKAYYNRSYDYGKEVGDIIEISVAQYGLALNAFEQNEYNKSITLTKKVIQHPKTPSRMELLGDAHQLLSKAYSRQNNFAEALEHATLYNQISDSIYSQSILTLTNDLEAKYQNEQQEKEIALLSSQKDLQELKLKNRANERNLFIGILIIVMVITALLFNQYRIKQSTNKKLKELDQLKTNFFTNISHEFRTPLTLIKGPIERMMHHPEKALGLENINMIHRNTERLLRLVNQLLDLSKIEQGSLQLEPLEGNIYKCLRAVAASFESYAAQHHYYYQVEIPKTDYWTAFDRDKIEKIGYNLLSNAFKFSDSKATIHLNVLGNGEHIVITVSDTGMGIAEDKVPHLFDRFYQIQSGAENYREGTGIGLSLTKELVELMGGTLQVKSELGKGTTFTVRLPMKEVKKRAQNVKGISYSKLDPLLQATTSNDIVSDRRKLPTILVVEDNVDMRSYLRDTLLHSFKVIEAENGQTGLKTALTNPPDLVITDLMMPEMDGLEFCKGIKTNILTSHVPVIMLTAKSGLPSKLEGLETGADDYLTKPFEAKELLVRCRNLIQQRQKLRSLYSKNVARMDPAAITVTPVDQKFLQQLLALMDENFSNPEYGIPQLQNAVAMSRSQFQRKVRALTDETPGTLLRQYRLKRAAQLLNQNADNVTQIAYSVGFNNLSYFTKCFRELYGVTPSEYAHKIAETK